jgi:hypothetical protein
MTNVLAALWSAGLLEPIMSVFARRRICQSFSVMNLKTLAACRMVTDCSQLVGFWSVLGSLVSVPMRCVPGGSSKATSRGAALTSEWGPED